MLFRVGENPGAVLSKSNQFNWGRLLLGRYDPELPIVKFCPSLPSATFKQTSEPDLFCEEREGFPKGMIVPSMLLDDNDWEVSGWKVGRGLSLVGLVPYCGVWGREECAL